MADIKSKCKIEPNEYLLRTILGGSRSISESEACVSQFILYNGYFGRGGCCGVERCRNFSITHEVRESMTGLLRDLILEAIAELVDESADRNPLILVLDADVQMLPWENLPVLRKWEVYRMPSLASVITTLGKSLQEEPINVCGVPFPSIDPSDAYYVLNPSGDLSTTQVEFEEWFREKKWEGKAGNAPTAEELVSALQNHDLFVYFGHGNGTQYITGHEIQKLNRCSATLLMGCSSGSLQLKGSYAPRGAPLSYLFAGSPAVIANLWDVTDKDINRFSKVILNTWLREESDPQTCCTACHSSTNRSNVNTRRKATRGKKLQENAPVTVTKCEKCRKEMRVTSFMSQARDACKLPLLIGAAPVCYGVPTVIKRKDS
ncbi:hypothetical protein QJS10_CPA09g00164 [Acorus calamus]|uniref:separase n=1 Tax=Acorus calamus TaxID=4465 RepID=A0AAV9E6X2_ACOCL|nr:hypothetical protein QJS10_CPA09g00164 [Acorus calamus]